MYFDLKKVVFDFWVFVVKYESNIKLKRIKFLFYRIMKCWMIIFKKILYKVLDLYNLEGFV